MQIEVYIYIDYKELTISISSNIELELNTAKQECYREGTKNRMIADLIARRFAFLSARNGNQGKRINWFDA